MDKGIEKKRSRKESVAKRPTLRPELLKALIAAGAVFVASPAHTQKIEVGKPQMTQTQKALPKSVDVSKNQINQKTWIPAPREMAEQLASPEPVLEHVPVPRIKPQELIDLQNLQTGDLLERLRQKIATAEEIRQLEDLVESDKMHPKLQVKFMEDALKPDGHMYREIQRNPDDIRNSKILKLRDLVSTRLTLHYKAHPDDPNFKEYFDLDFVKQATRHVSFELEDSKKSSERGKTNFCNRYLAYEEESLDVYFITAAHCLRDAKDAGRFKINTKADMAVMHVPQNLYQKLNITNPLDLPRVSAKKDFPSASGQVIAMVSTAFESRESGTQDVFFSIASPTPQNINGELFNQTSRELYPDTMSGLTVILPHEEAYDIIFTAKDPVTGEEEKRIKLKAGGRSGSAAVVPAWKSAAGMLQSVRNLSDGCRKVCEALGLIGNQKFLHELIRDDQAERAAKTITKRSSRL